MSFIIMSQKVNSLRNYSPCRYSARLCSHPAPTVCGGLFWTPWAVMMAGVCCAKQRQDEHKHIWLYEQSTLKSKLVQALLCLPPFWEGERISLHVCSSWCPTSTNSFASVSLVVGLQMHITKPGFMAISGCVVRFWVLPLSSIFTQFSKCWGNF